MNLDHRSRRQANVSSQPEAAGPLVHDLDVSPHNDPAARHIRCQVDAPDLSRKIRMRLVPPVNRTSQ